MLTREALPAFDRRGHGLAAERGRDDVLDVLDHDAVARQRLTVGRDVEVIAADPALGIGRRGPGNRFENLFNLLGELVHLDQVGADHLDPDRRPDAGRQHVDPRLDRHGPGIGDAQETAAPCPSREIRPSIVRPGRHSSFGFRLTTVSNISEGAGSVAVSARPALPYTEATSGNDRMILSWVCISSPALVTEMPGSVVGI